MTSTDSPPPSATSEEWEIQLSHLKSTADAHFRSKSYPQAIAAYASALALDPTNHILLSNKSAAHLANGEKSKALHDARKCVESKPDWVKGYTRLGAAMVALGRYKEAMGVYGSALKMDEANEVATRGLQDCREKERQEAERKKEEAARVQAELDRRRSALESKSDAKSEDKKENNSAALDEQDDLLDDFFSEVEKVEKPKPQTETTPSSDQGESINRIKIQLSDLGTSASQINRLLQTNYEWKNLNPFYVLDVPHTIDDESVLSARYRALSLLVHPDKNRDDAVRAKAAFEQVKKAMELMNNEDKRRHLRQLVEQGCRQGRRDWEESISSSVRTTITDEEKEDGLSQAQTKATMKIFATIEAKRRDVERRKRKYEQRERAQEDEEKEREKNERDYDKEWREKNRVEKRVGNWRDFQKKKG